MNLFLDTIKLKETLVKNKNITPRRLAYNIMLKAEKNNKKISDLTLKEFTKISFTQSEKKFTTNLIQGCVRMKGRLNWELNQVVHKNYFKLKMKSK